MIYISRLARILHGARLLLVALISMVGTVILAWHITATWLLVTYGFGFTLIIGMLVGAQAEYLVAQRQADRDRDTVGS